MPLPRVFDTAIPYVFSMCSALGDGTLLQALLLLRWRRLDYRAFLVRNSVRWRDCTGK